MHKKICFLSLNAYPVLTGKNLGYAGGAEVQQVLLAKELVAYDYDISFVTYRHGNNTENVDGIEIIKTYERDKANEISEVQKSAYIFASLKKANADIYFHSAGSTGVLPLYCALNRKKFVHRITTDAIVLGKPLSGNLSIDRKIADLLEIKRADSVVAQSNYQKNILKERFNVESVVIRNGMEIPPVKYDKPEPPIILWVGTMSSVKRPDLFIELAKAIPNASFEMIGGENKSEPNLYNEIAFTTQGIRNIKFHGFIPYQEINNYFRRSSIFVNTSTIEGFPNTFIQAWAHYLPVISLNVDPDKIIQSEKIGFHSGNFKNLVDDVVALIENNELREDLGRKARRYVEREHNIKNIAKKYIKVFQSI
jgi:glycosyltransferase involved in cell wall biosynthesis